jgi:hypothetical protein
MSVETTYDVSARLRQLGHPLLAQCVRDDGPELTLHCSSGAVYCVYRPRLVLNVLGGKIALGEPAGRQLLLDPSQVKVSSGVSRLSTDTSIAWERFRESL